MQLETKVKVYSKLYEDLVTGEVTKVFDNGDLQVVGLDKWEGVVIRCPSHEAEKL